MYIMDKEKRQNDREGSEEKDFSGSLEELEDTGEPLSLEELVDLGVFEPMPVDELTDLIETEQKDESPNEWDLASLYYQRGCARDWDSDATAAEEDYIRASKILESINDDTDKLNQLTLLVQCYDVLGNLYSYTKQNEKAFSAYTKGIEVASTPLCCYGSLGDMFYKRGLRAFADNRFSEALEDFCAAINEQPDNWEMLTLRGICYFILGQFQDAICDYSKALLTKPEDLSGFDKTSRKLIQEYCFFQNKRAEDKSAILELRAQCFEEIGLFDKAIADRKQAREEDAE